VSPWGACSAQPLASQPQSKAKRKLERPDFMRNWGSW
jgi:hypothetical protein